MKDLTDLDYKDLFRDAVNMMAHIARAAGFDPADPTVEPPAIVARVENLRAEVERLTAERTALLAPVEGVDLEEVLRLDREGTAGPWHPQRGAIRVDLPGPIEYTWALAAYPKDVALIAHYRTAAPALAREVIQLRAAVRFADEQGAEAIDRVSRAIVADKWNSTAKLQEEVKRLTAELEEARLTLAAEQGRAEGGPPGWVYEPGDEDFDEPGEWVNADRSLKVWRNNTFWVWGRRIANGAYQGPKRQPKDQTARAAMLAAASTPETDRP